jgi:hypothetical protein
MALKEYWEGFFEVGIEINWLVKEDNGRVKQT